ncbi:TlpA family protein disulfide reductase [Sulfurospirillum deleyianum]|uniref:Redoxin domain protein n=1 Tax=Sulfurospirillum deleyianum (strain ATCC 51133 / DSM 6946 / 5175) TaxID=525898 RepID=D1B1E3_SULD5|nr:TlpA disulfide reductase family protein [Sulfurospirillum deleyianum]ACZ11913.1 Redoxin domain protein [Sulfurospirillum deleyianum DSM 6946]
MKFWLTLFVSCSILFFHGCSSDKKRKEDDKNISSSQSVIRESVTLQDVNGNAIVATPTEKGFTFSGFENKVVLLNFFTTWCPPCKAEIPHLNNLQEKYKENFVIISVLLEENKSNEELLSFIKFNAIKYTITNGSGNFALAQSVGGVKNIPLMFLYDKAGNYATHYVGAIPEEMIDADIKKVL